MLKNPQFHYMKLYIIIPIIVIGLSSYFVLALGVFPEKYLEQKQLEPSPYFEAILSDTQIQLGESFLIQIDSENVGDYGDIYIISAAFPELDNLDGIVKITNYDLSHTPLMINVGDEIGASYTGGVETVFAKYPSIEAMNRPVPSNSKFNMDLLITPQKTGPFVIYVKNIAIPHVSEQSHFPRDGILDHQNEYVKKYTVEVIS